MDLALRTGDLSVAKRLKVGAVVVRGSNVLAFGYNGTPTGWKSNDCEYEEGGQLITVPEIIHAEMNAIYKLAQSTESGQGATMFCTHAPCIECAKATFMAGIREFVYLHEYRSQKGLDFLAECGTMVTKL